MAQQVKVGRYSFERSELQFRKQMIHFKVPITSKRDNSEGLLKELRLKHDAGF